MTIIDWIFCYIAVTGLIACIIAQPRVAEIYHALWCKKHQYDIDYEKQRRERALDLTTLKEDRLSIGILALLLGWVLVPAGLILSIFKVKV